MVRALVEGRRHLLGESVRVDQVKEVSTRHLFACHIVRVEDWPVIVIGIVISLDLVVVRSGGNATLFQATYGLTCRWCQSVNLKKGRSISLRNVACVKNTNLTASHVGDVLVWSSLKWCHE